MENCSYCQKTRDFESKIFSRIFHRCRECDLIYKSIQENYHEVLATYSRGSYFDRYSCDQTNKKRDKLYDYILDSIEEKKGVGRLLDVGTGCGFFLDAAKKRGWQVKGVEPSKQSVEVACRQNKLDVFCGTLQEYSGDNQFDVITFINVLDHSAEPWREIERANRLLKPGGILCLPRSSGRWYWGISVFPTGFYIQVFISWLLNLD